MSLLNVTQAEHEVRAKRKVRGGSAIQEKQLSLYLATDLVAVVLIETALILMAPPQAKLAHWQEIKCIKGWGVSKITHCLPFSQICFNECHGARGLAVVFLLVHCCLRAGSVHECPFHPCPVLSPRQAAGVWILPPKVSCTEHPFPIFAAVRQVNILVIKAIVILWLTRAFRNVFLGGKIKLLFKCVWLWCPNMPVGGSS